MRVAFFKLKQTTNTRLFRRYARVLIRCILIAVLVWVLLFFYAFVYKFEKLLKNNMNKLFSSIISKDSEVDGLQADGIYLEGSYRNNLNLRKNEFELSKILNPKSLDFFKQIQRRPYDINCQNLIEWNEDEVRKAKRILFKLNNLNSNGRKTSNNKIALLSDENFLFPESKCRLFRELRGYDR